MLYSPGAEKAFRRLFDEKGSPVHFTMDQITSKVGSHFNLTVFTKPDERLSGKVNRVLADGGMAIVSWPEGRRNDQPLSLIQRIGAKNPAFQALVFPSNSRGITISYRRCEYAALTESKIELEAVMSGDFEVIYHRDNDRERVELYVKQMLVIYGIWVTDKQTEALVLTIPPYIANGNSVKTRRHENHILCLQDEIIQTTVPYEIVIQSLLQPTG